VQGQNAGLRLVLYHRTTQGLRSVAYQGGPIILLIGPEGGLSEGEIELAQDKGFIPVCVGPRVLRTETAAVAALAAMQVLWGDAG
jgi:16S rRNA (uracil1498-N3)-methyltransferase